MGGGGGKGGESTQSIDPALTAAARDALDFGAAAAAIPYSPNRGVQYAAFTPQQEAAMANSNDAAGAFGLQTGGPAQMPQTETSASGIRGYSTGADYDQMKNKSVSQALQAEIAKLFVDPNTGKFANGGPGGGGGGGGGGSFAPGGSSGFANSMLMSRDEREQEDERKRLTKLLGMTPGQSAPSTGGSYGGGGPGGGLYRGRYAAMPATAGGGGK